MIKSDFGTIEVTGLKPVVMAEFASLLEVLKRELGEEDYNRILQDVDDTKESGNEPEEKKSDFEPHLVSSYNGGEVVDYGCIGEGTNIFDIIGNSLKVGDTVNLCAITNSGKILPGEECPICKRGDGSYFVMSVLNSKFDRGVDNTFPKWLIILNRRHTEVEDGEVIKNVRYIKSERTGK